MRDRLFERPRSLKSKGKGQKAKGKDQRRSSFDLCLLTFAFHPFQRSVCKYARTSCISASVYFPSWSTCASRGSLTVNRTCVAAHDRYQPDASVSAIVNSSRYASRPVMTCPEGSVTVTCAARFGSRIWPPG